MSFILSVATDVDFVSTFALRKRSPHPNLAIKRMNEQTNQLTADRLMTKPIQL